MAAISTAGCVPLSPVDEPADTPDADGAAADTDAADPAAFRFAEDDDPVLADQSFEATRLILRLLPGGDRAVFLDAAHAEQAEIAADIPELETVVLSLPADRLQQTAARLASLPVVEGVQRDYLFDAEREPNDPQFDAPPRVGLASILGLTEAWDVTVGAEEVVIAVLDSGVQTDHLDLADKLLVGWNSFNDSDDYEDTLGHGTSVAGVAAAIGDNNEGIAGVAWSAGLLPVRVTNDRGQATSSSLAAGIVWAVNHGAKIINISFAPISSDRSVLAAAAYARSAGRLVVISAGNDGELLESEPSDAAIFVGATDFADHIASFSSYGPFVDLVAPGVSLPATKLGDRYGRVNGTSYASPVVSGTAALIWSVRPELRPTTVESILTDTAVDLGSAGRDDRYGFGRVDAGFAIRAAEQIVQFEDDQAPDVEIDSPRDGSGVEGTVQVKATAEDDEILADVVLWVDGVPFATDTSRPFRFALDTDDLAAGTHTLSCQATDVSGNASEMDEIQIAVGGAVLGGGGSDTNGAGDSIPPTAVINFPADGTPVASRIGLRATLTDNQGLARAEWSVDGRRARSETLEGTRAVVSYVWDASKATRGTHRISIRAIDAAGNDSTTTISVVRP